MKAPSFLSRVGASVVGGTLTCTAAIMMLSWKRTGSPWPGLNCTAHWLRGNQAANVKTLDVSHTVTGVATNVAAIVFWAVLYETALGSRQRPEWVFPVVSTALGPVAAAADYGATPKRFTPGWEFIFNKHEMAVIYGLLVIGMVSGSAGVRSAGIYRWYLRRAPGRQQH